MVGIHGFYQLLEIFSHLLFLQFPLVDNPVEELAALNVLHDDVNLGFGHHEIIEPNDLGCQTKLITDISHLIYSIILTVGIFPLSMDLMEMISPVLRLLMW